MMYADFVPSMFPYCSPTLAGKRLCLLPWGGERHSP
jgi:hypothetical protein